MKAEEIIETMEALRDETQRQILMRFFRTGKGQYGEGDDFLGVKVPQTRAVVKAVEVSELSLPEIDRMLQSRWHEVRLCGLLLLVKMVEAPAKKRNLPLDAIVRFYLDHAERINNWDLVDLSAPRIVGRWLMTETNVSSVQKIRILDELAHSGSLWRQRITMVCTWWTSRMGDTQYALRYAEMLLDHPHDLMHKAVGWMLREVGKRNMVQLQDFLEQHVRQMPRTTLRYAIEKMSVAERQYWMNIV